MERETVLWLSPEALDHNFRFFKSRAGKTIRILVNLKADAYGHGAVLIGKFLQHKTDYFSVAYANEGFQLRNAGISIPVLVFNPPTDPCRSFFEHRLEPVFYHTEQIRIYKQILVQLGINAYPVHLKLDSGMHRSGLPAAQLDMAIKELKNPVFKLVSVYSHLAAADDPAEDSFTRKQISLFDRLSARVKQDFPRVIRHLANSAAAIRFPEAIYDMIRPGIGIYGYTTYEKAKNLLKPVASLQSAITQIREVDAGESVGYNRRFVATRKTRIALIPTGYGDGYFRLFGNGKAYVTIEGKPAPTIGTVSMDMLTVDITHIPQARIGSLVCIFGEKPSVYDLAQIARTIPYEITTALHERVLRKWNDNFP